MNIKYSLVALATLTATSASALQTYTVEQSRPFSEICAQKANIPDRYQWKQAYFEPTDESFKIMVRWETKDFLNNTFVDHRICDFSREDGSYQPFNTLITIIKPDYRWKTTLKALPAQYDAASQVERDAEAAIALKALEATYYESEATYDHDTQLFHGRDAGGDYIRIHDPKGFKWLTSVIQDGIKTAIVYVGKEYSKSYFISSTKKQPHNATSINGVNDVKLYSSLQTINGKDYADGVERAIKGLTEGQRIWLSLRSNNYKYSTNHKVVK